MLEYNCISVETCWWPGRGLRRRRRWRRLSRGCWWNGTSWSDCWRGCLWLEPPTFANMGCHPGTSLSSRYMESKKGNFQTNTLGNTRAPFACLYVEAYIYHSKWFLHEDEDGSGFEAEGCPPVDGGGRLIWGGGGSLEVPCKIVWSVELDA